MAVSGSASPSFIARIVDGQLVTDRQALRQGTISDIDRAVHELLQGREIFLSARSDVVYRVRATLLMVLGGQNDSPTGGR